MDRKSLVSRLDLHWAAHLGCSPFQLRDAGRHVVARPSGADGVPPPWPLRRGPVALVTTGTGWVLSVPANMIERATSLCTPQTFRQLVAEGDRSSQQWFDGGAHSNPKLKRAESDAAYTAMNDLVSGVALRGWSHYVLSYGDAPVAEAAHNPHVHRISPDQSDVWDQFRGWPGPMCGTDVCKHFAVSDAFGYVLDGKLVSVAQLEAQSQELEWEYGIDTLPEYRSRGFATAILEMVTAYIAQQGHIPWHYTDHYNRPSRRLPKKLGYFQYGEGFFSHMRTA